MTILPTLPSYDLLLIKTTCGLHQDEPSSWIPVLVAWIPTCEVVQFPCLPEMFFIDEDSFPIFFAGQMTILAH